MMLGARIDSTEWDLEVAGSDWGPLSQRYFVSFFLVKHISPVAFLLFTFILLLLFCFLISFRFLPTYFRI